MPRLMHMVVLLALVAVLAAANGATARPAVGRSDEQRAVAAVVDRARKSSGYKNTQPIIGVLTQPCTDCPGRCEGFCVRGCSGHRGLVAADRDSMQGVA
jgi:hypothetical protein